MNKPMMSCGHAANATDGHHNPVCVICVGIHPGARTIATTPDLTNRIAECGECNNTQPSSTKLAFFKHQPDRASDSYYCGCRGWN